MRFKNGFDKSDIRRSVIHNDCNDFNLLFGPPALDAPATPERVLMAVDDIRARAAKG